MTEATSEQTFMAITGHRPGRWGWGNIDAHLKIIQRLDAAIRGCRQAHPDLWIITGMALGVDMWVAEIAERYSIPFTAYVPCKGQFSKWQPQQQKLWQRLILKSQTHPHLVSMRGQDAVRQTVGPSSVYGYILISDRYYTDHPQCMTERNEAMVDDAHMLLACWDGRRQGGTFHCHQYAVKSGMTADDIIRVNADPNQDSLALRSEEKS